MRRFALLLLAGASSLVAALPAQGFGVYEHNACTMGRAGVAAANPCPDGSAIFFNPAGLAGLGPTRVSAGVTLIAAQGGFTDDILNQTNDLQNPVIPVPAVYFTHPLSPKLTVGIGAYAPYGLETKWDSTTSAGRFMGYNTEVRSIYIQPTLGYQITPTFKFGIGFAYITSSLKLRQRTDFSQQLVPSTAVPPGTRFAALGVPTGTDFADAHLEATGDGYAVNIGGIVKVSDKVSIGGHWLTRKKISYEGTVEFNQVPTGLVLPPNNPLGLPGGTPVDAVVAANFGAGAPLSNGKVTTSLYMPPQGTLGIEWKFNDSWTFMGDYQYVVWGWFTEVNIDFENPATPDLTLHPNNSSTHGFRFGTEYQYDQKVKLRGGYLYHTGASPDEFVTPLLPEGPRNEFTIGAGIQLSPKLSADVAYQYINQNDRRGTVNTAAGNTGLYNFSAHLFGLGAVYTF